MAIISFVNYYPIFIEITHQCVMRVLALFSLHEKLILQLDSQSGNKIWNGTVTIVLRAASKKWNIYSRFLWLRKWSNHKKQKIPVSRFCWLRLDLLCIRFCFSKNKTRLPSREDTCESLIFLYVRDLILCFSVAHLR